MGKAVLFLFVLFFSLNSFSNQQFRYQQFSELKTLDRLLLRFEFDKAGFIAMHRGLDPLQNGVQDWFVDQSLKKMIFVVGVIHAQNLPRTFVVKKGVTGYHIPREKGRYLLMVADDTARAEVSRLQDKLARPRTSKNQRSMWEVLVPRARASALCGGAEFSGIPGGFPADLGVDTGFMASLGTCVSDAAQSVWSSTKEKVQSFADFLNDPVSAAKKAYSDLSQAKDFLLNIREELGSLKSTLAELSLDSEVTGALICGLVPPAVVDALVPNPIPGKALQTLIASIRKVSQSSRLLKTISHLKTAGSLTSEQMRAAVRDFISGGVVAKIANTNEKLMAGVLQCTF